jgi:hypothetical protein
LDEWLASVTTLSEYETQTVEYLRKKVLDNADFWNEDELKLQFIAPLLLIVNLDIPKCKVFSQRQLNAKVKDIEIGGRVDFMLATGKQKPIQPYFFIHEYKQERKRENDPKGQLLAELLAAQYNDERQFPLFGCYVVGRNCFFIIFDKEKYAVSDAFVSSSSDIYQIIAILKKVKVYVEMNLP